MSELMLHHHVQERATSHPDALAVVGSCHAMTYQMLDDTANQMAHILIEKGVKSGDRVGIWAHKSVDVVAMMQAILRIGAVYVPLDPSSPFSRMNTVLIDCDLALLVTTHILLGDKTVLVPTLFLSNLTDRSHPWDSFPTSPPAVEVTITLDTMAYILYTSGSTGTPKGVCISHGNALAFVKWAVDRLKITSTDRLANHAPFHFDLSVFDIYAAFMSGASMHIIEESMAYIPDKLVAFIQEHDITTWYSVPSVLIMMMIDGSLLESDLPTLRNLIFAGEPFPPVYLKTLVDSWYPKVKFFNFYGPTETNVCTYFEVTDKEDLSTPIPIGKICSGNKGMISKENTLVVSGPTVMLGYWGKPSQDKKPYFTGDRVSIRKEGQYMYLGRLDDMVKVRGHRIELGDIDAVLTQHPKIRACVSAVVGSGLQARIIAFVVGKSSTGAPSLIEIKQHCAAHLPRSMIVDKLVEVSQIPITSTGKYNRRKLVEQHISDQESHIKESTYGIRKRL
ncbi:MAG: amino acid adenylation domain-containing protein [Candidatus Margulisbacteria bacterium]|nr:amino acid adenylation domain-containing protein [Candidatus Margulisiibacteriota bacterium]